MKETNKFRKGYEIHFQKRPEREKITQVAFPNDRMRGEVKTDKGEYSLDFLMRWLEFGFIKVYKNVDNEK